MTYLILRQRVCDQNVKATLIVHPPEFNSLPVFLQTSGIPPQYLSWVSKIRYVSSYLRHHLNDLCEVFGIA